MVNGENYCGDSIAAFVPNSSKAAVGSKFDTEANVFDKAECNEQCATLGALAPNVKLSRKLVAELDE
jgi:hypothetical protein